MPEARRGTIGADVSGRRLANPATTMKEHDMAVYEMRTYTLYVGKMSEAV